MRKIVLICVDDQREVLNAVARDLTPLCDWVQVEECESASEAEDLLDELDAEGRPVGLLVCDHIMPGKNGVAFLTELANDPRFLHTRKVLLTGQATHKDTIDAVNGARIDHYFEKPWRPEDLVAVCRRLLTEYLFASGLFDQEYRTVADPQVVLARLRGRE